MYTGSIGKTLLIGIFLATFFFVQIGYADHLVSSDKAHISYRGNTDKLKYAKWNGASWETSQVDGNATTGQAQTWIALDSNNHPRICYQHVNNGDLRYAKWTGSSWSIETVDSADVVGDHCSLSVDSDDKPHISYYKGFPSRDLKYAKWTGSSWSIETVDSSGDVGTHTSIALDSNGNPHIAYHYPESNRLKYAKWTGSSWDIQFVTGTGGAGSASKVFLVLDSTDKPHIVYEGNAPGDGKLQYAKWTGSAWDIQTVDANSGYQTSLALDTSDRAHISYKSGNNLKYAKWTSSWNLETVETRVPSCL